MKSKQNEICSGHYFNKIIQKIKHGHISSRTLLIPYLVEFVYHFLYLYIGVTWCTLSNLSNSYHISHNVLPAGIPMILQRRQVKVLIVLILGEVCSSRPPLLSLMLTPSPRPWLPLPLIAILPFLRILLLLQHLHPRQTLGPSLLRPRRIE